MGAYKYRDNTNESKMSNSAYQQWLKTHKDKREVILISQSEIDVFREEVMALKPKKRKNWKGSLVDKWGVRTKIIYDNDSDEFLNYSLINKCYCIIRPYSYLSSKKLDTCSKSPLAKCVFDIIEKFNITDEKEKDALWSKATLIYQDFCHTGNHVPMSERLSWNMRKHQIPA